jgi:hypothetical protein
VSSCNDPSAAGAPQARAVPLLHELGSAFVTFAICRALLFSFDLLVMALSRSSDACPAQAPVLGPGWGWLDVFFRWDSYWYLQIASEGYSFDPNQQSNVAFFPLYPYLARALGWVLGGPAIGGLVAANVATIVAVFYLRRLGRALFDERVGQLAGVLLLVFPTALFLSVFYTEGLFLALTVACMFYYFRERFVLTGVLGFLATLTRSTGLALFGALALDLCVRVLRREQRPRLHMLALGIIPLGLVAYTALLRYQVHDPLALSKSMKHWQRAPAWPWEALVRAFSGVGSTSPWLSKEQAFVEAVFGGSFLALGAAMAVQRWPVALWSYVVLGVLMPLSTQNIAGLMRYVLVLFPAFLFLAWLCRDRRDLQRIIIAVSACFLGVYSVRYMHCYWSG